MISNKILCIKKSILKQILHQTRTLRIAYNYCQAQESDGESNVNYFDFQIITFVNQFSQHSLIIDKIFHLLSNNHLLKGGILAIIIWWAWFKSEGDYSHNRKHIILTLISCIFAIALARGLALTLPFRFRPLHQEGINFLPPHGVEVTVLDGWSSFPSDHAVLFFVLSVGFLFISKKMGILSIFYTILFICFPRIYLGFHYPTDIIAGAILGTTIAIISNLYLLESKWLQAIESWSYFKTSLFYPLFFLFTYQIADMFDSSRAIISVIWKVLQKIAV